MTIAAWISGTPEVEALRLGTIDPPVPAAGELLLEVKAAALNFSDLLMVRGHYQVRPPRPFVPGQEVAGIVLEAPAGSRFAAGQAVAAKVYWGGFARQALVREEMAIPLDGEPDFATACALPVSYSTAIVALDHLSGLRAGQSVLVHAAAGGLGLAAVQLAACRGARVFATAGSAEKCALALANGAEAAFNYAKENWREAVRAATDGVGVDLVLDSVGGEMTAESLSALAYGGSLLIAGFSSGRIPKIEANRLLLKKARAIGVYWSHDKDPAMMVAVQRELVALYRDGRIAPVIGQRFDFEQLPAALEAMAGRRTTGKVVLS